MTVCPGISVRGIIDSYIFDNERRRVIAVDLERYVELLYNLLVDLQNFTGYNQRNGSSRTGKLLTRPLHPCQG